MRSFFLIIILFFLVLIKMLQGCNLALHTESRNEQFIIDSFILDIDSTEFHHAIKKVVKDEDNERLLILSKGKGVVYFLEDKAFKLFKTISVSGANNIIDIDYHSCDTIYFLLKGNVIAIADSNFVPYHWFNVKSLSKELGSQYTLYSVYSNPFRVIGNIAYALHFPVEPYKNRDDHLNNYFAKKLGVAIDLEDSCNFVDYSCQFPDIYKELFFDDLVPRRIIANNLEISSFSVPIDVTVRDLITKSEKKVPLRSNYYKFPSVFDYDKKFDYSYISRFHVENFKNVFLLYDEYRKQYYRICLHSRNYENPDGTINNVNNCNWSIVVSDLDFKVKNEILFTPEYSYTWLFITKRGVLIRRNNSFKYDNEKIELTLFNL